VSREHFEFATDELLKSLDDGLDLLNNCAEYILAWESLDEEPSEFLHKSLKGYAEYIFAKEEGGGGDSYDYENDKGYDQGAGYLHALGGAQAEPTNHVWADGLRGSLSSWPDFDPPAGHPYRKHEFPFHPFTHPLLRRTVDGKRMFSKIIRSHVLGPHSRKEKEMEEKYTKELLAEKHPLLFGFVPQTASKHDKRPKHLLGSLRINGTIGAHQHDLYERDYARWKQANPTVEQDLIGMGLSGDELEQEMRHRHVDERAEMWETEDTVMGKDGMVHPTQLGHMDYMLGLEWLSPEERTRVKEHIKEHGDSRQQVNIRMGESITGRDNINIPYARLVYNALYRMTPEMHWATNSPMFSGRNKHLLLEDNENDFHHGEGRFEQAATTREAHKIRTHGGNDVSVAGLILNELNDLYDDERSEQGHKRLEYLPRFDVQKNGFPPIVEYDDLRESTLKHFGKKGMGAGGVERTRLHPSDLKFLAGYHPETDEVIEDHPIYGPVERDENGEPQALVPRDLLDEVLRDVKTNANVGQQAKNWRKHRSFLSSPFGPHPDRMDESPTYWQLSDDGQYTFGPAAFWNQTFAAHGGAGMSPSTYMEMIHSSSILDPENDVSVFFDMGGARTQKQQGIHPNERNESLAMHFSPEESHVIGEFGLDPTKGYDMPTFNRYYPPMTARNVFSPFGVTRKTASEGSTEKNNHADMASSLSPMLEYRIRHMTAQEKRDIEGALRPHHPMITRNSFKRSPPSRAYSGRTDDSHIDANSKDAHYMKTLLGQANPPNEPAEKSVHSYKDYVRNRDVAHSGGLSHDEMLEHFGWGMARMSQDQLKRRYLTTKSNLPALRLITNTARMLGTTSPAQIKQYLDEGDFSELKAHMNIPQSDEIDVQGVEQFINEMANVVHGEETSARTKAKKRIRSGPNPLKGLNAILHFGGSLPAMEREQEATDLAEKSTAEYVQLLNQVEDLRNTGREVPEQLERDLRESAERNRQHQVALEREMSTSLRNLKSNKHYEKDENIREALMRSHRGLVAQVARDVIMPKMLEFDGSAFDPQSPAFLANSARALRDAERYIKTVPHSVHGLKSAGYDIGYQLKETKRLGGDFHKDVARHLAEEGALIDGNMSVSQVLDLLGMRVTPETKEHARRAIDASNEMNSPLRVSTIGSLLSTGKMNIGGHTTEHYAMTDELANKPEEELTPMEKYVRDAHEHGHHEAIGRASQDGFGKEADWKQFTGHRMPQFMHSMFRTNVHAAPLVQNALGIIDAGQSVYADGMDLNGRGTYKKGKAKKTAETRNYLDSIVHFNESALQDEDDPVFQTPQQSVIGSLSVSEGRPVGAPLPSNHSIYMTHNTGLLPHASFLMEPTVGVDPTRSGELIVGDQMGPGLYATPTMEDLSTLHGQEIAQQGIAAAPPHPDSSIAHQRMDTRDYSIPAESPTRVATGEMTTLVNSLLNSDLLKEDKAEWAPLIRPMHRIFALDDLEHLRGFSGSWVVSKWYDGRRVLIIKDGDEERVVDEKNRKVGIKKAIRESIEKLNSRNYVLDGILGESELNVIDIVNYDDNNLADMQLKERMKILRSQFDSHDKVIIPGPHDTKFTDTEGLAESVRLLQEEHENIMLRDSHSTYMKGEHRHPKWVLLRPTRDYNFIILNRTGKGPFSYQLGAGPILDGSMLGNRAVEYEGNEYMDVGTARNQSKPFKVGDIVRASVTGITKKNRGGREVYNVQVRSINALGEGEGPASTESLDLLTKSFSPIQIPHELDLHSEGIVIRLQDVDEVIYKAEKVEDAWYIHSPFSTTGVMHKQDYPVTLAESLLPYWGSVAPLLLDGHLRKQDVTNKKPPSRERQERQSAGVLDAEDENRLLKPDEKKKALSLIIRALDRISKEKMTSTGVQGLGIGVGTPNSAPTGPTKLRDDSTLPDYDMRPRPGQDRDKEPGEDDEENQEIKHLRVVSDDGTVYELDSENGQPVISEA